nr:MAG TPA: hypothetical protein [Microviridae sp.]
MDFFNKLQKKYIDFKKLLYNHKNTVSGEILSPR